MKKIILIFLIFSTYTLLGQVPDKDYKFKITSQYSGDEVLSIGSELEITKYQTINWKASTYAGSWSFSGNITGFSKSGNDITVNFNLSNNPYGHSGTIRINLDRKFLQFFEPSIDYSSRQNKGTYYFEEILDFGDNILIAGEYECSSFKIMNKITPIYSSLLFKNHSLEYEDARGNQRIEFVEVNTNNQKSTGSVMRNNIKFGTFILSENKLTILSEGITLIYDFKLSKEKEERLRVEKQREQNERLRIEKEKQEEIVRKKKEEENRIKLENQNKDADKTTLIKINDLISKNSIEDAAKEYGKLNFEYDDIRSSIQKKLNDKYENEVVELNFYNIEDYIKSNKYKINSINPGNYSVKFDTDGSPLNTGFPQWPNLQYKEFGSFTVKMNSKADIKIVIKDSILVSTVYNKSNTKPLFVDKNENFYFKSKNGLPAAQFVINPAIDKNSVNILKYYKREKYANGILLGTEGFYFEKTVEINKKDY